MKYEFKSHGLPKVNLSELKIKNDTKIWVNSSEKAQSAELKINKLVVEACEAVLKGGVTNNYDIEVLKGKAVINQIFQEVIPAKTEADIFESLGLFSFVRRIGLNEAAQYSDYEIIRSGRAQEKAHGSGGQAQKLTRRDAHIDFHSITGFVKMDYRDLMDDPYGQTEKLGEELATQIRNQCVTGAEQSLINGMVAANAAGEVSAIWVDGLTKAGLDITINEIRAKGMGVKIVGGYLPLANISSFPTNSAVVLQQSERNLQSFEDNGYVGVYNGAVLSAFTNPFKYGATRVINIDGSDYTVWDRQLVENYAYVMPAAEAYIPNLTFLRGGITTMLGVDIDNAEEMVRADQKIGYKFIDSRTENVALLRDDTVAE